MKEDVKKEGLIDERSVKTIFDTFDRNISGSELYFSKFSNLAATEDKDELTRTYEYLKGIVDELGIHTNSKNKSIKKKLSTEQIKKLARRVRKTPKITHKNFEILANSSFLMVNNYFEYLLSDLLSYYYNKFNESIGNNNMNITLNYLDEFESVGDVKKDLIQKEIEAILIDTTFPNLMKHFEESLKIELSKDIVDWGKIDEFRERRHLIVHNSARVNKRYITRTGNPFNFKQGDFVNISSDYFDSALKEFKLAGYLLIFSCWGKWDGDKSTEAIENLMMKSFEALKTNDSSFALRLTMYIKHISPRNEEQEDLILRTLFNKCIALRMLERNADLLKELKQIKVGTASPIFKLVHAILSNEKLPTIISLIKQSHTLKEIDIETYLEWPIYSSLRANPEADKLIRSILKEPANTRKKLNKNKILKTKTAGTKK